MNEVIRIGVFYDGNYFLHVSNYYNYHHQKKARISIGGLHELTREIVANEEGVKERMCKIVDAHYFRGRLNAAQADEHNKLYAERAFDDILMSEGVITHYLPLRTGTDGHREEKGIDVWLALEAYDMAIHKAFNVVVLIACDGDYVPLARKLNSLGIRVMVLGWDFEATTPDGRPTITRTSQDLLAEVSYPVKMHPLIEDRIDSDDPLMEKLFVQKRLPAAPVEQPEYDQLEKCRGPVMTLKNGYGFIERAPNNVFFHYTDLIDTDFADLREGDLTEFLLFEGGGRDGGDVAKSVRLAEVGNEISDYPAGAAAESAADES